MGSGASANRGEAATSPKSPKSTAAPAASSSTAARSKTTKSQQQDEFDAACMVVFRNADRDNNGKLDRDEFWSVLKSKTLNLNLSEEEMQEIQRLGDADGDGFITYTVSTTTITTTLLPPAVAAEHEIKG